MRGPNAYHHDFPAVCAVCKAKQLYRFHATDDDGYPYWFCCIEHQGQWMHENPKTVEETHETIEE